MGEVTYTATFPLNVPTRNHRIYTSKAMQEAVDHEYIQESMKQGTLYGRHTPSPMLYNTDEVVKELSGSMDIKDVSFSVRSLDVDEEKLTATIIPMPTASGEELKRMMEPPGQLLSFAPRGVGEIGEDGKIKDGYRITSFDLISTRAAITGKSGQHLVPVGDEDESA